MNTNEILNILSYFILYSFLGWVLESIAKTIIEKKLVNSGFLHGPFCPIYGIGAIIMYLALKNYTANPVIIFLIGFVVLSIWEYAVGILLEKLFHTKYWDYSENKFNFQGRVCLMNSIFWGVLGVLFIYIIHPFIQDKIQQIPQNILIYLNIMLYAYLITDMIVSIIKVKHIDLKLKNLTELGDSIKEKLEKLEEIKKNSGAEEKQGNLETLQNLIEELKAKQAMLRKKLYRHTYRLKKAFPTMKSEAITGFLNQKLDELKKKQKEK